MAKVTAKIKELILWVVLGILLIFSLFRGGVGQAYAAEAEGGGLMQEIETLTVNGKKFSAADYPVNAEGIPQLLNLCELGYGSTAAARTAYGLVLYIYNPAQLELKEDVRNTVQMKIGSAERYSKYAISLVSWTADMLFYKFRVDFTDGEKSAALAALNADGRVYDVSSIELYTQGFNATDYPASRAFTYTGYAAGEGDNALKNTVTYVEYDGVKPERIKVHHTSWRPEGTNGNSEYTQDTIHSVYFAVSKEFDEQYDYLKSIHAHWLRARTNNIFVTGDKETYDQVVALQQSNANPNSEAPSSFDFSNFDWAFGTQRRKTEGAITGQMVFDRGFGFKTSKYTIRDYAFFYHIIVGKEIKSLYLTAYTGGENASSFVLKSSEIEEMIKTNNLFLNDKKVAGKYPSYLFENYDEEFTDKVIEAGIDKNLDLHSEKVNHNLWLELFAGISATDKHDYTGIDAIKVVTDADNVESKSPQEISDSLYISPRDAEDFQTFYKNNKADNTIYILRFAVSEYKSETTDIYKLNKYAGTWDYDLRNSNGYIANSEAFLDFDIIDFEYAKGAETIVIPVSMSPIDIFTELTPPPKYYDFWKYAAVIAAALIAFYIVYKIAGKAIRS